MLVGFGKRDGCMRNAGPAAREAGEGDGNPLRVVGIVVRVEEQR